MQPAHLICMRLASMLQGALGDTGTGIPCFYRIKDRANILSCLFISKTSRSTPESCQRVPTKWFPGWFYGLLCNKNTSVLSNRVCRKNNKNTWQEKPVSDWSFTGLRGRCDAEVLSHVTWVPPSGGNRYSTILDNYFLVFLGGRFNKKDFFTGCNDKKVSWPISFICHSLHIFVEWMNISFNCSTGSVKVDSPAGNALETPIKQWV